MDGHLNQPRRVELDTSSQSYVSKSKSAVVLASVAQSSRLVACRGQHIGSSNALVTLVRYKGRMAQLQFLAGTCLYSFTLCRRS